MNKSDKLRLYGQKDYTELIEFPVELVGKDDPGRIPPDVPIGERGYSQHIHS